MMKSEGAYAPSGPHKLTPMSDKMQKLFLHAHACVHTCTLYIHVYMST